MADFGTIGFGAGIAFASLWVVARPERQYRHSRRLRDARIAEIDAGSPETFFEERRELESYAPKMNFSAEQMRSFGLATLLFGIGLVAWGFVR